jgi:hypothetical protein
VERQKKDQELLKQELEQTISKPILPETIQAMKDGRTRCIPFYNWTNNSEMGSGGIICGCRLNKER